jgi:hypothetical protein
MIDIVGFKTDIPSWMRGYFWRCFTFAHANPTADFAATFKRPAPSLLSFFYPSQAPFPSLEPTK